MLKSTTVFLICSALLFTIPRAIADTDKIFSTLLNEPVSILTFGLKKLEDDLRETLFKREEFSGMNVFLGFPAQKNRISITVITGPYSNKEDGVDACTTVINEIRNNAGVDVKTGRAELEEGTIFSSYFWQWGKDRTVDFNHELDKKFHVTCSAQIDSGGFHKVSGRLVSNEIILGP